MNSICSTLSQSVKHPIMLSLASTAAEWRARLVSLSAVCSCGISCWVEYGVQSSELFGSSLVVPTSNGYKCWIGHCIIVVRTYLDSTRTRAPLMFPICSFNGTHNPTQPPESSGLVLVIHCDHFSFHNSSIHTSNKSAGAVKLSIRPNTPTSIVSRIAQKP